jgi:hypothetical protein
VEAFTQWVLVADGRLGWGPGGWSSDGGRFDDLALRVGEDQPVRIISVAADPQQPSVMQTVMPWAQARLSHELLAAEAA